MRNGWTRVVPVVLLSVAMLAGCSRLQASKMVRDQIDQQAADAAMMVKEMPIADARAKDILVNNAQTFDLWASEATTNWFYYAFSSKYQILVTPQYMQDLQYTSLLARDTAQRCATQPSAWLNSAVAKEARAFADIKAAKDGVPSKD